jgi:hypothetical protein
MELPQGAADKKTGYLKTRATKKSLRDVEGRRPGFAGFAMPLWQVLFVRMK